MSLLRGWISPDPIDMSALGLQFAYAAEWRHDRS
jgi:hypothetical protein